MQITNSKENQTVLQRFTSHLFPYLKITFLNNIASLFRTKKNATKQCNFAFLNLQPRLSQLCLKLLNSPITISSVFKATFIIISKAL